MSASVIFGDGVICVRCIQGHSGRIAEQIISSLAHTQIKRPEQCSTMCHYTHSDILMKIIGPDAPGLLPGGRLLGTDTASQEGCRSHLHLSRHPVGEDGVVPENFKRRNIDCCIRPDATLMLFDKFKLFLSDADVILVEEPMPLRYILTVNLIRWPKLCMYNRLKPAELEVCEEGLCCCSMCGTWHSNGSWVCLECWNTTTISGIHDRQTYVARDDRAGELLSRYGLSKTEFEALRKTVGSNIAASTATRSACGPATALQGNGLLKSHPKNAPSRAHPRLPLPRKRRVGLGFLGLNRPPRLQLRCTVWLVSLLPAASTGPLRCPGRAPDQPRCNAEVRLPAARVSRPRPGLRVVWQGLRGPWRPARRRERFA